MRTHGFFQPIALAVLLAGMLASPPAGAVYRDLCSSVPSACEYSGPWAPVLSADVCWSRSTGLATLRGSQPCPTGTSSYTAKYGTVDPLTLQVFALIPVDDACTHTGICQPAELAPPNTTTAAMCCIAGVCTPQVGVGGCDGGQILMCSYGVTNDDGTVECFDDEEV